MELEELQHFVHGQHETGSLLSYFEAGSAKRNDEHGTPVHKEVDRHMCRARRHELAGKRSIPSGIRLTGIWGNQAWHIDTDVVPFRFHLVTWDAPIWKLATSFEKTLDMLDVLIDSLVIFPSLRSMVIREVISEVPGLTADEERELEAYARAAGMY